MSEMVKRVARAICCRSDCFLPENCQAAYAGTLEKARAALAAMREPTDQMCHAGAYEQHDWKDSSQVWQAMIDEALR